MISPDCSFKQFADAIKGDDYYEILYKVEQEATEAERCSYRGNVPMKDKEKCGKRYADILKNFLQYLRYGIKVRSISDDHYFLFMKIGRTLQNETQFRSGHLPTTD